VRCFLSGGLGQSLWISHSLAKALTDGLTAWLTVFALASGAASDQGKTIIALWAEYPAPYEIRTPAAD